MYRVQGRVSFIIPAYNAAAYLEEALQSVLTQDYSDIEVIVVDDGSSDRSFAIASNYPDKRVRAFQQANGGPSAARNTGFRHSTGEFIWYLDADDVLVEGSVEKLVAELKRLTECAFAVGAWRNIDGAGKVISEVNHFKATASFDETYASMLLRTPFPPSAALFRASAVEASGGWDEDLWCAEDRDFYLRVLESNFGFKSTDIVVFRYRIHDSNATLNTERIEHHSKIFLEKWFGDQAMARKECLDLYPYAAAIAYCYIARQCDPISQQSRIKHFTLIAADWLSKATRNQRETDKLLWETVSNPMQVNLREVLWNLDALSVSHYCWTRARATLRAGEKLNALRWLFEILRRQPGFVAGKLNGKSRQKIRYHRGLLR